MKSKEKQIKELQEELERKQIEIDNLNTLLASLEADLRAVRKAVVCQTT